MLTPSEFPQVVSAATQGSPCRFLYFILPCALSFSDTRAIARTGMLHFKMTLLRADFRNLAEVRCYILLGTELSNEKVVELPRVIHG